MARSTNFVGLKAQMTGRLEEWETVASGISGSPIGNDKLIVCHDCRVDVSTMISLNEEITVLVENANNVLASKGLFDSEESRLREDWGKILWEKPYSAIRAKGFDGKMTYESIRDMISKNFGYLPKAIWMVKFNEMKEPQKTLFTDAVRAEFESYKEALLEFLDKNLFSPMSVRRVGWMLTKLPSLIGNYDEEGNLRCPACGSSHVTVDMPRGRGKTFTVDDGYDKKFGFNDPMLEIITAVDDEGVAVNLVDLVEDFEWEPVSYEEFNTNIQADMAESLFWSIIENNRNIPIEEVCRRMGRKADLIADVISDYYIMKSNI